MVVKTSEATDPNTGEFRERFQAAYVFAADETVDADVARALQVRIAMGIGADMRATKLAQPMRLAGSLHRKGSPQRVTLTSHGCGARYTLAQLEEAFPADADDDVAAEFGTTKIGPMSALSDDAKGNRLMSIHEALTYIPQEDYDEWVRVGMALKATIAKTACTIGSSLHPKRRTPRHSRASDKVEGLPGRCLGAGTIFALARGYGCDLATLGRKYPSGTSKRRVMTAREQVERAIRRSELHFQTSKRAMLCEPFRSMTDSQLRTYDALKFFHDGYNNGDIRVSLSVLGKVAKQGKETVSKNLKALVRLGMIVVVRKGRAGVDGGASSVYEICEYGRDPVADGKGGVKYGVKPKLEWGKLPTINLAEFDELTEDRNERRRNLQKKAKTKAKKSANLTARKHPKKAA